MVHLRYDTYLIDIELYRPQLASCYLIQDSNELALIDCGTQHSVQKVIDTMTEVGASPQQVRWIIPTHVHLDHAGGAGHLMQMCPNATLVTHVKGLQHLLDPSKLISGATAVYGQSVFKQHFGGLLPIDERRCLAVADEQTFDLGKRQLLFFSTPGHANHHGCIFDSASTWLFTGDTFGLGYQELAKPHPWIIATTTPVSFDPNAWQASLKRMLALQPSAVCLTHFGQYEAPTALAPMLSDSIEAHRQIALQEEAENNREGRHKRLAEKLKALFYTQAKKHSGLSEGVIQQLLRGDVNLNAQGIEVWLARRAKNTQC